jgi:ferrochelatase
MRPYLAEFLADPRVVELPRALWLPILHGIILRTRPARSAAKYSRIWTPQGAPLKQWSARQAVLLGDALAERGLPIQVRAAMRYGRPSIAAELDALKRAGARRILVLQGYPQYSDATTASVIDAVNAWCARTRVLPELRFVGHYHDDPLYIRALAQSVRAHWQRNGRGDLLLMSFHGIPVRAITQGDPYEAQCHRTAQLLAQHLQLPATQYRVTFQSRFGNARWLEPSTARTLSTLGQNSATHPAAGTGSEGAARVDVICPGFVSDCLETLEEIAMEGRDTFMRAGGRTFHYIPCLNGRADWIDALATLAQRHLAGWIEASD